MIFLLLRLYCGFIDYENLALGTGKKKKKQPPRTRSSSRDEAHYGRLVDKGRITAKRAYCDWRRFPNAITPA